MLRLRQRGRPAARLAAQLRLQKTRQQGRSKSKRCCKGAPPQWHTGVLHANTCLHGVRTLFFSEPPWQRTANLSAWFAQPCPNMRSDRPSAATAAERAFAWSMRGFMFDPPWRRTTDSKAYLCVVSRNRAQIYVRIDRPPPWRPRKTKTHVRIVCKRAFACKLIEVGLCCRG